MKSPLRFILNPVSLEKFLASYYQQQALHIRGNQTKFNQLFSFRNLNDILNSSPQPHPGVKMSQNSKQSKPKDAIALIRSVQGGASLILENADRYDLALGDFLNRLTEEIGEETRFNLYLSYPENQGYRNHYDTHDFFILQVSGYKEWWIFPETIPSVLFFQKTHGIEPPLNESCYLHCKLGPGDVLYVPRGHWHYAIARDEPSLHLTLAIFTQTGIDFMKWLIDELTDYEQFRRTLPLVLAGGDIAADHHIAKWLEQFKIGLAKILDEPDLYNRFLKYRIATSRNRQPFQFPVHTDQLLEGLLLATRFKRRIQRARVSLDQLSGRVEFVCAGRKLIFDCKAESVLRFIFSREEFTKEELLALSNRMSWQTICSVLLPLIKEGYICPSVDR